MTVQKIQHPDGSFGPDLSGIEDYESVSLNPDGETYTVKIKPEKVINDLKEEAKALKAENKLLRDRIATATDFTDLKTKLTAIKDSETTPLKWTDKVFYLAGVRVEDKGIIYTVKVDHTADKNAPPGTSDLYTRI